MINHEQYHAAIMADPRDPHPALREHREHCAECRGFTESLLRFESRLERALDVKLPAGADVMPFERKTPQRAAPVAQRRLRRFAIAASLALGVAVAGGLWLALPQRSLAADVVAHVEGEPQSWQTDSAVTGPALDSVLKDSKFHLKSNSGIVSYASSCLFRGHMVPHLVEQTESGPVTVMVLVHESVARPVQFDEQGYHGIIVPVPGHGSMAVLMRGAGAGADAEAVQRIAARMAASIDWTN